MKKPLSKSRQKILQAYQHNLREVVGLSAKTCRDRFRDVGQFLEVAHIRCIADLTQLRPGHLVSYLSARSADYQPASLRNVASTVRDFLRRSAAGSAAARGQTGRYVNFERRHQKVKELVKAMRLETGVGNRLPTRCG